jgi:hypothetical protein
LRDIALDFQLQRDPARGVFVVRLTAGSRTAEADFACDLDDRRFARALTDIDGNRGSLDDLQVLGGRLWSGLLAGEVGELLASLRRTEGGARFLYRLCLPPELEPLPWEALYSERDLGFLSSHPLHVVLRNPPATLDVAHPPPPLDGRLRLLAVVPSGAGLDTERELQNLERTVGKLGDLVELVRLAGRVSPDQLGEALARRRWDVLHFSGHGEVTESGRTNIRLNSDGSWDGDLWMDGEVFGHLFLGTGVRLAVLNCCLGATASSRRSLSGLGHFLLRSGVPAVVAMRYEVPDAVAVRFSGRFYQEPLNGREPGRIDLAVEAARESIFRHQSEDQVRDFVTPALYAVPGGERLFERVLEDRREATQPASPTPPPVPPPVRPRNRAVELWQEKLDFLLEQEALLVDPAQKFALRKQIEEAREKIREG